MGLKHKSYHIVKSDSGQMLSKQQLNKNLKITIASPFKSTGEKEKGMKKRKTTVLHANAIPLQFQSLT